MPWCFTARGWQSLIAHAMSLEVADEAFILLVYNLGVSNSAWCDSNKAKEELRLAVIERGCAERCVRDVLNARSVADPQWEKKKRRTEFRSPAAARPVKCAHLS